MLELIFYVVRGYGGFDVGMANVIGYFPQAKCITDKTSHIRFYRSLWQRPMELLP